MNLIKRAKEALEGATPGPWAYNTMGEVGIMSTADDQSFGMVVDVIAVAEWPNSVDSARLIALSPDLARLAIAAGELAEMLRQYLEIDASDENLEEALARFRAIAEGKA